MVVRVKRAGVAGVGGDSDVVALVVDGGPAVYRYLMRLTGGDRTLTEDLLQETCLATVRAARGGSTEDFTVGWMIVVARRRFVDHLRRNQREQSRLAVLGVAAEATEPDWDSIGGDAALELLGQLPHDQRAALIFRYIDDLAVRDVAELLRPKRLGDRIAAGSRSARTGPTSTGRRQQ